MSVAATSLTAAVREAVATVCDPEFPGIGIAELGIVESVDVAETGDVAVGLVPTFLGCPALATIKSDVEEAVSCVPGVGGVSVEFLDTPTWSPDRVEPSAREKLATEFTVAVRRSDTVVCPVCASTTVVERSPFGPTACRAIAYCEACMNPVEVMRQ